MSEHAVTISDEEKAALIQSFGRDPLFRGPDNSGIWTNDDQIDATLVLERVKGRSKTRHTFSQHGRVHEVYEGVTPETQVVAIYPRGQDPNPDIFA